MSDASGLVLVVDDQPADRSLLVDLLDIHGYRTVGAASGEEALAAVAQLAPDVVLLDVMMPGMSGLDVCRALRADSRHAALPIVLVTAKDPETERVSGLEAGADDFLAKPVNSAELFARVRSLLRVKRLLDQTEAQAVALARLNGDLQQLVAGKVAEVERLSQLRRFLAPPLAERIVAGGGDDPLVSHRRDIAAVFLDLRGFTSFSERSAPEDVMSVLRELHQVVGTETQRSRGTIERFVGDGVMVFFNDPEPVHEPCVVAARFALDVFHAARPALARWRDNDFCIGLGCGIAYGYATLGAIGFSDRIDYGAIGMVSNLGARLCAEARAGEILVSARVANALPPDLPTAPAGAFTLKGFRDPVPAFRLLQGADEPR
jgi:class 3 adenylate cyclase